LTLIEINNDLTILNMYRKLPLYILVSGSSAMGKESFESIRIGFQTLKDTCMMDPFLIETLQISIIQMGSDAWSKDPMIPIHQWTPSLLFPEGKNELVLGAALTVLNYRIAQEVTPLSLVSKGDFCPLIVILVSSPPTDDWVDAATSVLNRTFPHLASCLTILVGSKVKASDFKQVSGLNPMYLNEVTPKVWRDFFRWIDQ
jgi:uncharacterized protein YegL